MANARPGGWNDSIIAQFRANGGQMTSGPFTGRTLLLLTTKGAKALDGRRRDWESFAKSVSSLLEGA